MTTPYNMVSEDHGVDTWEYRVLKDDTGLRIIEAYLDSTGLVMGWCEASGPQGNDADDLLAELGSMANATNLPVLTEADLGLGSYLEGNDTP